MLIMAIQGVSGSIRDQVVTQLTKLPKYRVVTIDVSFHSDPNTRVAMMEQLLHRRHDVVNVVTGADTALELAFLRAKKALFCHVRGAYPESLLRLHGGMNSVDVSVVPDGTDAPDWYLTPEEAFSELLVRRRRGRAA